MLLKSDHKAHSLISNAKWIALVLVFLLATPTIAQDNKPVNNKGKIKQTRAKSVKKKEKASTKDIAGKRLRTKNTNSVAGRAVHSNPSPYANERRGRDRAAKPINGQPNRIRSRSAESARNNVYPQRGPFVNRSSKSNQGKAGRSRNTRSGKLSISRSAETSRSNAYPQKGPFVNRSSKQTDRAGSRNQSFRRGRLSTNTRSTGSARASVPRSRSSSAETSKGKRFQQSGSYVNRSSKNTETTSAGINRFSRKTKLSAGPRPPGKKKTVVPRSGSQQFVTRGKKNVYWGKFSKGEKAITTDVSGSPLRRRNYRTPPNEIIQSKNPYEGRKQSRGDRAYSGTFVSGHVSISRRTENPWKGDVSGQAVRKRSERQNQVAGQKIKSSQDQRGLSAKFQSSFNRKKGIKPDKGGGGSVSGRIRSNKPLSARAPGIGASAILKGQNKVTGMKPRKGAGGSVTGKYKSNKSLSTRPPGIGAVAMLKGQNKVTGIKPVKGAGGSVTGKFKSNKPISARAPGMGAVAMLKSQNRITGMKPVKGAGGSVTGKYKSNKPISARAPGMGAVALLKGQNKITGIKPKKGGGGSISDTGKYRSNKAFDDRIGPKSISGQNRVYDYKPSGGGSISATGKYRSNKAFDDRIGPKSISGKNRIYDYKPHGGGSISGKLWNNKGQPIEVRTPSSAQAAEVGYSGRIKLSFFKRTYVRNPNAVEQALKKESPLTTVYMADGLQVSVKARQTGTKPKAVKGSMPGLAPSRATVKASEYSRSMKVYWSYKHNPSSADESQKTIGPSRNFVRASDYSGRSRLTKNYRHNPMSDKDALKVVAPGRAYARITDYQGNVKMSKYKDKRLLPDARFAHTKENNVKSERTIMTDFKLLWTKIFKKNGTQPNAVKEKGVRPRYDKNERDLWPGLYD